jgi:hypothetical protein
MSHHAERSDVCFCLLCAQNEYRALRLLQSTGGIRDIGDYHGESSTVSWQYMISVRLVNILMPSIEVVVPQAKLRKDK